MPKGYHHVTREQRSQIAALKAIATPHHKIAQVIGVSPSSVCRELAIPEEAAIGLYKPMIRPVNIVHARANYLKK